MSNEIISNFWKKATTAEKYEESGLWGLKASNGEIVLKPKYDQIEVCTDFIYVHYGNRHTFFYKDDRLTDCADRDDDLCFYENGFVGLKNAEGGILLPAMYDEVIDWGTDCDVVYVRKGHEFHYYNHKLEEILTDAETFPNDAYPEMPYSLGEDQNRNVLICVEPTKESKGSTVCYAYNQWVKLSRISYNQVRDIFSGCKIVQMSEDALNLFEDKDTYIYSARKCRSSAEHPISDCIERFKTLECYDSSWHYLVKIDINPQTKIEPHDLYCAIKHFEDMEYDTCISYDIAIDYDESLAVGEVCILQIHYFWDDMGAFLDDKFKQDTLRNGTVEDVRKGLDSFTLLERRKMIHNAYWWVRRSETRDWAETERVLNYLKSEGCDNMELLITSMTDINHYYIEDMTDADWDFMKEAVVWALANGAQLNFVDSGMTCYEKVLSSISCAKEREKDSSEVKDVVKKAETFAHWLKSMGAHSVKEQRAIIEKKLDGLTPQEVFNLVKSE